MGIFSAYFAERDAIERDARTDPYLALAVRRYGWQGHAEAGGDVRAMADRYRADPDFAAAEARDDAEVREERAESRQLSSRILGAAATLTGGLIAQGVTSHVAERAAGDAIAREAEAVGAATDAAVGGNWFTNLWRQPAAVSPAAPGGAAPVLGAVSPMRLSGSAGTMAPVGAPAAAPRVSPDFWSRYGAALAAPRFSTRQPAVLQPVGRAWAPVTYRQPTPLYGRGIYAGYSPWVWR